MKKIFFAAIILLTFFCLDKSVSANEEGKNTVRIFVFYSDSCPHCKAETIFLDKIKNQYDNLDIHYLGISNNLRNVNYFSKAMEHYELSGGVPTMIIGDEPIIGFDNENGIGKKIKERIDSCSEQVCNSYMENLLGLEPLKNENNNPAGTDENKENASDEKNLTIFGKEICIDSESSICFWGVVLGLADGVNPCMFSVLIFLLTYLLAIGSRKRTLKAGIAFVATTFAVYFIFMYGIIEVVSIIGFVDQLRMIIIAFALVAGIIMLKDFFFYGKWLSLEIPQTFKPKLENLTRKGTVLSAIMLAILASLVELPCTSGLPLAYVSILSNKDLPYFGYLILYNLFFILPLLVIVLGVTFAWTKIENIEQWRLKMRKYMRLVAGLLLVFIAIALWKNWL